MQKFIEIGKIVGFRGLDGTLKLLTSGEGKFKNLKQVYIKNCVYNIKKLTKSKNFIFLKLEEILDINSAEKFKDELVFVDRINIDLAKNEYLICDVLGMKVYNSENEFLGIVDDIDNFGAQDVYTVKNGTNEITFCLIDGLFKNVDLENNKLILNTEILNGVMIWR